MVSVSISIKFVKHKNRTIEVDATGTKIITITDDNGLQQRMTTTDDNNNNGSINKNDT